MCIAAPARIVELDRADAIVDIEGRRRRASLMLGPLVAVGDVVLVAAGRVLRRLEPGEAEELMALIGAAAPQPRGSVALIATDSPKGTDQ